MNIGSPRAEVGEIDTRSPFQSVKAALNLFADASTQSLLARPSFKKKLAENAIDKETQLLLAQAELNNLKQQLEAAELTRAQAVPEMERAGRAVRDLTAKVAAANESKRSAAAESEAARVQAKRLEAENSEKAVGDEALRREDHAAVLAELGKSKRELEELRRDFAAAPEAKLSSLRLLEDARRSAGAAADKARGISTEISGAKASVGELESAAGRAREEKERIGAEMAAAAEARRAARESEAAAAAEREIAGPCPGPETEDLERVRSEIEAVREETRRAHESEMARVRAVTEELDGATRRLDEIGEEEIRLRGLVKGLEAELASVAGNERRFAVEKLTEEAESARREREEVARSAEAAVREAEGWRKAAEEAEMKLREAAAEAAAATDGERTAVAEMRALSPSGEEGAAAKVILSVEEFDALAKKVEEAQNSAELKEAESVAAVHGITARKVEALRKLEANLRAVEEIKAATDLALRKAEMSDSAKIVVESELRKWRQELVQK